MIRQMFLPPSPNEHLQLIKAILDKVEFKCGEREAYLLSKKWFSDFKTIVGYDNIVPINAKIPPIDNSDFVVQVNPLKIDHSKKLNIDYIAVSSQIWSSLIKLYGGGPEAAVSVEMINNVPTPIPFKFSVFITYKTQKNVEFQVFDQLPINELIKEVRERFGIMDDTEIRLLDPNKRRPIDVKRTIIQNRVTDNAHIIVDYKTNGWASEHKERGEENEKQVESKADLNSDSENLDDTYSTTDVKGPGICGLRNIGNTCYFNAAMQCILHTPPLTTYFLSSNWKKDYNQKSGKLEILESVANLFKDIWSGNYSVIPPFKLKDAISKFAPQFSGTNQQDAHELLTFLLDGIHEALNNGSKMPIHNFNETSDYFEHNYPPQNSSVPSITRNINYPLNMYIPQQFNYNNGNINFNSNSIARNEEQSFKAALSNHSKKNSSIIVNLFHGMLRSQITCPFCNKMTVVYDPYMTLSLPLVGNTNKTVTVTFVPFNFSQPYQVYSMQYQNIRDIFFFFQQHFPGVYFLYCYRQRNGDETFFQWGMPNEDIQNEDIFILEIPPTLCYYIGCVLKIKFKQEDPLRNDNKYIIREITAPFLVPVDNFQISKDEFVQRLHRYLDNLWDKYTPISVNDKKVQKFLNGCQQYFPSSKNLYDDLFHNPSSTPYIESGVDFKDYKLFVDFPEEYYIINNISQFFKGSNLFPNVSHLFYSVYVNPEYMNQSSSFNFQRYILHIDSVSMPPGSNSKNKLSLDQCFEYFSENEKLDDRNQWFCRTCKKAGMANKKMDIMSSPKILVIQFKRFMSSHEMMKKLDTEVIYPDILDLSKYIPIKNNFPNNTYKLYGVVEHLGGLYGGHYIAHAIVKNKNGSKDWYMFNDSSVLKEDSKRAHSHNAYLLFYERIDQK